MKEKTNCLVCGKKTKYGGKTCSRDCSDEFKKKNNREIRNCKVCKSEFYVKKNNKKEICSDNCRKIWGSIKENKENRIKKTVEAIKEKYGVEHISKIPGHKEKIKYSKLKKYGNENYNNIEKNKQTKLENHGNENYNNIEKNKQTKLENHGNENYNNREQAKSTCIKKYGVEHVLKVDFFKLKRKETLNKNFGVSYPLQSEEIKKRFKQTNLEKYGFEASSMNEGVKNKLRNCYKNKFNETKVFQLVKRNNLEILSEYKSIKNFGKLNLHYLKCLICENKFYETFANNRSPICRKCNPTYKNNSYQVILREFFNKLNLSFEENYKHLIFPFEVDFYFKDLNIAIEINGNYFHSELSGNKNKEYHKRKSELCLEKGVKLIHIFEDELVYKLDIVFSRLKNYLNKNTNNIYARKCNIKVLSTIEKNNFLQKNHIQGKCNGKIFIGLVKDGKIFSVLTMGKTRNSLGNKEKEKNVYELIRFCNLCDYNVVGGFSKLLKFFIKEYNPIKVITYADIRWSGLNHENTVYNKNGFKFISITNPNYWYVEKKDYLKRYHRYTFRKSKLIDICKTKSINYKNKTEWQIAQELNMDRIWDCGSMKFEMDL